MAKYKNRSRKSHADDDTGALVWSLGIVLALVMLLVMNEPL